MVIFTSIFLNYFPNALSHFLDFTIGKTAHGRSHKKPVTKLLWIIFPLTDLLKAPLWEGLGGGREHALHEVVVELDPSNKKI